MRGNLQDISDNILNLSLNDKVSTVETQNLRSYQKKGKQINLKKKMRNKLNQHYQDLTLRSEMKTKEKRINKLQEPDGG